MESREILSMPLAPDSTLKDVKLSHPKTYYPPLLKCMEACAHDHGTAYMSIGVTGGSSSPYYRISVDEQANQVIGAYDYGNPFPYKPGPQWSTKSLGLPEVVALAQPHL
jgi:hypothetical protein